MILLTVGCTNQKIEDKRTEPTEVAASVAPTETPLPSPTIIPTPTPTIEPEETPVPTPTQKPAKKKVVSKKTEKPKETTSPTKTNNGFTVKTMTITYYCSCTKCCGPNAKGITASGKQVQEGMVAMKGVPFGTKIEINGKQYVVEDRGVGAGCVDVYVSSHQKALELGRHKAEVKIYD